MTGISRAKSDAQIFVIVYDKTVEATLRSRQLDNVHIQRIEKVQDLYDKMVVAYRVRSAARRFACDVLLTLNFFVPLVRVPQVVYHVDLERFEYHSLVPLSLHNVLEKLRDVSAKRALVNASANAFESEFVMQAAKNYHSKISIRNPLVIYIGIDDVAIVMSEDTSNRVDDGLVVSVTNPIEYKNNAALVPVLVELLRQEPGVNWRVRIFGGKDETVWSDLISIAERAGVRERLEFMGYKTREVLNASLDSAICEFNTSKLESFCMVALEAMARGCPVIVGPESAMPESVGSAGLVIDPDDTDAVVNKILWLRSDLAARKDLKLRSVEWASEMTWSQSGKALLNLCEQMRRS